MVTRDPERYAIIHNNDTLPPLQTTCMIPYVFKFYTYRPD